ncbi:response regulator transcription factor [Kitasatospora griseola]|uniref:response regulator transcription factor n=1 Tax=Kitasatospora griseola TaxID=2064 RepID=UPI003440DC4C
MTAAHLAAAVRLFGTDPADPAAPAAPVPAVHRNLAAPTPRELEVLTMLGGGLSNGEPAQRLALGEATVTTRVARILAEPALRDRARAVVLAHETGPVRPGQ